MVLLLGDAFFDFTPRQTAASCAGRPGRGRGRNARHPSTPPQPVFSGTACAFGTAPPSSSISSSSRSARWSSGWATRCRRRWSHGGEFAVLPLFTTVGLMLLASANDFMLLFVALELVTISFYILVAYRRRHLACTRSGVKYLILGGLSSAFLVMGVAYIFGVMGSTRFDYLVNAFHDGGVPSHGLLWAHSRARRRRASKSPWSRFTSGRRTSMKARPARSPRFSPSAPRRAA